MKGSIYHNAEIFVILQPYCKYNMMKKEEILALLEQFEQAACEISQVECWSARELQKLLGYSKWENFSKVIEKAKEACSNAGQEVADHFPDVRKMVVLGSGAQREVEDVMLTRYALITLPSAKCLPNVASPPKTCQQPRMSKRWSVVWQVKKRRC